MRFLLPSLLTALLIAPPASADVAASDCDWLRDMRVIMEPWEQHTRTFYRGQVRVSLGDSVEPAWGSFHVLILLPDPEDELGGRKCVAINQGNGMGFSKVDWEGLQADYDPATGLSLTFRYAVYDPDTTGHSAWRRARVLLNLARGQVTVR